MIYLILYLGIVHVALSVICGVLASEKGYEGWVFFLLSLTATFFTTILIIIAIKDIKREEKLNEIAKIENDLLSEIAVQGEARVLKFNQAEQNNIDSEDANKSDAPNEVDAPED